MRNICRIANTNYSNSLVKIIIAGSYKLSFLSAWFADKSHADSCDGRRPFFADDFSAAEIILLAKAGQAKIAVGNFFGALFAPIFFESTLWAEKRSEFFGP